MKKLLFILSLLWFQSATSQTLIKDTTTAYSLSNMANGVYRIITKTDTLDITKDTAAKVYVYPVCPKVDTAYIQSLKLCPICPTCPTCPVCPLQRWVTGIIINPKTNTLTATYQNGTTTTLTLKNSISIQ